MHKKEYERGNDSLNTKLPVLNGKSWNRWMTQMWVLFDAENVLDLLNNGYAAAAANSTEAQMISWIFRPDYKWQVKISVP